MVKERIKKICFRTTGIFVFFVVMTFQVVSSASSVKRFLESYETEEGQMEIYCTNLAEDEIPASAEQFTAAFGSQELPVVGAMLAGQAKTPKTFYCLVDISGSMNQKQMDQSKEVLAAICDGMDENDNMVIGSVGDDIIVSDFLSDKSEIHAAIQALEVHSEDTNLYAGVVKGIEALETDTRANRKKSLLILSDGQDYLKKGITQKEAEQAVAGSSIPVYTVAALQDKPTDEQLESAKLLGSFARMSVGGVHYAPVLDNMDGAEVGQSILKSMRSGLILTVDTSTAAVDKDVLLLRVIYTSSGQAVMEDTMEVAAADLKPVNEEQDTLIFLAAGIIAAGIIAFVILIVVIRKKQKKRKAILEEEKKAEEKERGKEKCEEEIETRQSQKPAEEPQPVLPEQKPDVYEVKFAAIGYEQICYTLQIPEGRIMTLGRDQRAELILNPSDNRLSGVHCKVRCMDQKLNVWDMDSKNGTYINGVPVSHIGMATVESGQSIRMGSYEYRITIMRKEVLYSGSTKMRELHG